MPYLRPLTAIMLNNHIPASFACLFIHFPSPLSFRFSSVILLCAGASLVRKWLTAPSIGGLRWLRGDRARTLGQAFISHSLEPAKDNLHFWSFLSAR
ncbi:hypothetical protein NPIL_575851 [Nephila pilipes]|uniref:Uncharacterized protein n=1 Tax=Nephila pilipes TaxID=299642 RepID=A0A8X6R590_NEPPI|nr:hypothetical protein NPIL_575851 [Nephila pilipes]